jgi:hypothetical protein
MASKNTGGVATVKKTVCPVTREDFFKEAGALLVTIESANGVKREFMVSPKEFSTGSFGYNLNDKMEVKIGSQMVKCQLGLNLTVVGSKDAK